MKVQQRITLREVDMYGSDRVYKKIEVVGVSKRGIEGAIESALVKAKKTVHKLSWFEVEEIHGHIGEDGAVNEYQVLLKVAFQLEE